MIDLSKEELERAFLIFNLHPDINLDEAIEIVAVQKELAKYETTWKAV